VNDTITLTAETVTLDNSIAWTATAARRGAPEFEGCGPTVEAALFALCVALYRANVVRRADVAAERLDETLFEAEESLTPEQLAAREAARERLNAKRAAAAAAGE
jgi:hypothetical protein